VLAVPIVLQLTLEASVRLQIDPLGAMMLPARSSAQYFSGAVPAPRFLPAHRRPVEHARPAIDRPAGPC